MRLRTCHICGADSTAKGQPLKGDYCSPNCQDRARMRRFKGDDNALDPITMSDDVRDSYNPSSLYNPFAALFDDPFES